MSLYIKDLKPRVAKEDITVLKYVICHNNEIISPYQKTKISLNEVMVAYPKMEDIKHYGTDILSNDVYTLDEGVIHAMLIETVKPYPNFIGKKAIIPAGTEYWVSVGGDEIAARSMIITDTDWKKGDKASKNIFKEILETAPKVNGVRVGDYLLENGGYTQPREGISRDDVIGIVAGFHEEKPLIAAIDSFVGKYGKHVTYGFAQDKYLVSKENAIKMFNGLDMIQEYKKREYKSIKSDSFETCINYRKYKDENWYLPTLGEVVAMLNNNIYLNSAHQITGFGPVLLEDGLTISSNTEQGYILRWCGYFYNGKIGCSLENKEIGYRIVPFLGHRNCETELNTKITKIRKFKLEPAGATISKDGEFIHINDIVLALKEERESLKLKLEMNKACNDDWDENCGYALEQKIEFITNLIKYICYGDT